MGIIGNTVLSFFFNGSVVLYFSVVNLCAHFDGLRHLH